MLKKKIRSSLFVVLFALSFTLLSFSQSQKLIISEFMAINDTTLADEDGDYPDWIEIHNPGTEMINLNGWFLTDNPLNIPKWSFPEISINSGEYIIVFASEKNKKTVSGNLHTNFKLSGSGEFLALVEPDSVTISSSFGDAYPSQKADVSYGYINDQPIYMKNSTPGAANVTGDYIPQPIFSHERGFYNSQINVILSSVNSTCDIYYTLDGNRPNSETGTKYVSELTINKTTVLSAVAIDRSNGTMSEMVSQTYLFIDDILVQPNNPDGYTSVWGQDYPADYEMDPEICTNENKTKLEEALKSLPTLSIVTDYNHLFFDSDSAHIGGLYMNTTKHTEEWERPASVEYFDSVQNKEFQINCGLRIHGGNGRKPGNSPKHSFRLSFRSKYGASKLNFNLFDEKSATNEFNAIVLRAGYNYSWLKNAPEQCEGTDYIRDPFTRKTQLDMDRTASHTKYAHLYLNGLYWGIYDISEKITNDFAEEYLGGDEDDYDVVKDHDGVTDGDRVAWDSLMAATTNTGFESLADYYKIQGKNEDGTVNPAYQNLLDVRNFADYMIINYYIGNVDWDRNNWLAVRNKITNEDGFKFFCWDAENSMNDLNEDIVSKDPNPGNPSEILSKLKMNEEFKLYFADRVHKHFFNGGALTPKATEERYTNFVNNLNNTIIAESARWGDYRRDVDPAGKTYEVYTYEDHWLERVNYMTDTYFPQRSDIVFNQLKDAGLYPDINAPVYSKFGGEFESPIKLGMSAGSNTIYYTIDDTDPREIGGEVSSNAMQYNDSIKISNDIIVKARAKNGNVWSALTRAKFKVDSSSDIETTIITETICQGDEFRGYSSTGTYYITETSASGNDSIIEVHLSVASLPEIFIGNDTSIYQNETLQLESNSEFYKYTWNTSDTVSSIEITGSEVGNSQYWLIAEDDNGCINSDTINIMVKKIVDTTETDSNGVGLIFTYIINEINIYPNPVNNILYVDFNSNINSNVDMVIRDITGKVIFNEKHLVNKNANAVELNVNKLSSGLYYLSININGYKKTLKFIKE